MKLARLGVIGVIICLLTTGLFQITLHASEPVSGTIEKGYRILPIDNTSDEVHLTVYRGDYVKFDFGTAVTDPILKIPAFKVEERLPANLESAPYFKMKALGTVSFSLGEVAGDITVIGYQEPNYLEVTAEEAAELIGNIHPLILDVRTDGEYQAGHLENSVLVPVQELQARWQEISDHKDQDILIYCASGNRSTVASKILIDNGFKRIYNLRHGFAEWAGKGFPVVR